MATFLIIVREAFEAALLLGILYAYLRQLGAHAQAHFVTWGAALGVVASVGLGVAVSVLSGPLLDFGPDVVGIAVLFVSVGVLTWMLLWMRQHARGVQRRGAPAGGGGAPDAALVADRRDRVHGGVP
jgi:high-affinity iron transporter